MTESYTQEIINMRKLAVFFLISAVTACGGGGGGGSTDGESSTPSFDGVYEGPMNRVINTCDFGFDWNGVYSVEHNAGESTVTLQVGERYPQRYSGTVTSSDSFIVENGPTTNGQCTSKSTYTFEDINSSSARVRWTVEYYNRRLCFVGETSSSACTVAFEGVLPRK
jgi:hypothetical protein